MKRSLIYRQPFLYRLMMFILYGKEYLGRFKTIAFFIENRSSVVELCCGFGDFYAYALKDKQIDYLGVDLSPDFVKYGFLNGINIVEQDVNSFMPPPKRLLYNDIFFVSFLSQPRNYYQKNAVDGGKKYYNS